MPDQDYRAFMLVEKTVLWEKDWEKLPPKGNFESARGNSDNYTDIVAALLCNDRELLLRHVTSVTFLSMLVGKGFGDAKTTEKATDFLI